MRPRLAGSLHDACSAARLVGGARQGRDNDSLAGNIGGMTLHDDDEDERRIAFAVPPLPPSAEDLDADRLDPRDPDERALLIRAAHAELDLTRETVMVGGREINPRLHLALHEVVATRLVDDDPPEVWATARRLSGLGYPHHEVLHMLGAAMSGELWEALQGWRGDGTAAHRAALAALPESWERQRPGGGAPPSAPVSYAAETKRRRRAARRRNRRR